MDSRARELQPPIMPNVFATASRTAVLVALCVARAIGAQATAGTTPLPTMGFTTAMMTTSDFDVSPERRSSDGAAIPHRYVASNSIAVRLTDLTRIGDVIDAALARGATTVGDVTFSLSSSTRHSRSRWRPPSLRRSARPRPSPPR
ncbi:MAG: SIMPL domain-containing protein [Gemmatimonadaceae bacterium]